MIDAAVETQQTSLPIDQKPASALGQEPIDSHPDMKGRATPLEGKSPGAKEAQEQFKQMINQAMKNGGQPQNEPQPSQPSLANQLFTQAGINASTEVFQQPKKQGFLARIWEFILNLFGFKKF